MQALYKCSSLVCKPTRPMNWQLALCLLLKSKLVICRRKIICTVIHAQLYMHVLQETS